MVITVEQSGCVTTVRHNESKSGWEQWYLARSCVHHDHPCSDRALEQHHLKQAKERNAFIIDIGDLFCAMQGVRDPRKGTEEDKRQEDQGRAYYDKIVDSTTAFYEPYASRFLLLGHGNHETSVLRVCETDLTGRLAENMRRISGQSYPVAGGYCGWVRFMFTQHKTVRSQIKLYWMHGSGAAAPKSKGMLKAHSRQAYLSDADIVLSGHLHDHYITDYVKLGLSDEGVPRKTRQVHCALPTYKDVSGIHDMGWEVEKEMEPKPTGAAWLHFFYDRRSVRQGGVNFEVLRAI